MCIIDRKTYLHSDGRRETVETTTRCQRAIGRSLCKNVVHREVKGAQYVERRPSHDRTPSDGVLITEGKDGRQRVYRDLSNRSSNSSSIRRSTTMSERSSVTPPSSTSSPLYSEPKTAGPMPPPFGDLPSPLERSRQPYPPFPPLGPEVVIAPDGTAQYSRPPSLYMERAPMNERPSTSSGERTLPRQESSFDSTKAQVDDSEATMPSKPKRKSSLKIKTGIRPSRSSSSPSIESPGLSSLPSISHSRNDSAKDVPRPGSSKEPRGSDRDRRKGKGKEPRRRATATEGSDRLKKDADAVRRKDEAEADRRRRQADDEFQARIERGRLEESDRRQGARNIEQEAARLRESIKAQTREDAANDSSRERHRQAALSTLAQGVDEEEYDVIQPGDQDEYDPIRPFVEAEEAQMARERAAKLRRRESANDMPPPLPSYPSPRRQRDPYNDMPTPPVSDRVRREAEGRATEQARRAEREQRDRPPVRPRINTYNTSPASTRSQLSARTAPPVLHQLPSARHPGTIPQRGVDVIAREQARGSRGSGNMTDAFGNLILDDEEEYEPTSGQYSDPRRRR